MTTECIAEMAQQASQKNIMKPAKIFQRFAHWNGVSSRKHGVLYGKVKTIVRDELFDRSVDLEKYDHSSQSLRVCHHGTLIESF